MVVDAPSGPSPEEEAAFLAQYEPSESTSRPTPHTSTPEEKGLPDLPPLEDRVKRIPAPVREALEELFRARFVTVKRIPQSVLK
jgi:hypothetical protein